MPFVEVRSVLAGWFASPQVAWLADDDTYYAVWDFKPPDGNGEPVRMTFGDDVLMVWGRPVPFRSLPH